uniref:Glycosyltransferase family 92 protein n=2 Tax=Caenorhabditis japonica TaxID=281687 RepID=A0A8R1DYJ0_CAEJA
MALLCIFALRFSVIEEKIQDIVWHFLTSITYSRVVCAINIYTGPFEDDPHEHEILLGRKVEPSEMRRRRDLSLKETWMKRKATRNSMTGSKFAGVYVREAYRVSNEEIRLVYLENQDNSINLKAEVPTLGWQPVEWSCFNSSCFDILFCSMATRFGSIRLPLTAPHSPYLHLTTELNDEFTVVPVKDVRLHAPHSYLHTLGVCLQPIFFFTDWTIVIQFFESWLAQGASKFYFYLHSYTWQTKKVLDFYKQSLGDDLELIDWSDLPVHSRDRGIYEKDPNSRVFRHGATAFMHDCMLRARSTVKFIANTDLDDLPVSSNLNISKILNLVSKRHPRAAQFKADWILSHQPVVHFDMHSVYRNEPVDETHQHTTIEMFDNANLYFLHLRRFERHLLNPPVVEYNNSFDHSLLMKLNTKMLDQFLKRIEATQFGETSLSPWALEARQTIRDLEQCRREAFGTTLDDVNEMCQQSSAGCEGMLGAGIHFLKAPQTWVNVAHKAFFNSYVERSKRFTLF